MGRGGVQGYFQALRAPLKRKRNVSFPLVAIETNPHFAFAATANGESASACCRNNSNSAL